MRRSAVVALFSGLLLAGLLAVFALPLAFSAHERGVQQRLFQQLDFAATVHDLHTAMLDMETGGRGYLLTGEAQFLAPYQQGVQHYQALSAIAPAQAARAGASAHLPGLLAAAQSWQDTIALQLGRRGTTAPTDSTPGEDQQAKARFDQYRQVAEPLLLDLSRQLTQTRTQLRAAGQLRTVAVIGAGVLVLLLGAVMVGVVRQRGVLLRRQEQATTYRRRLMDGMRDVVVVSDPSTTALLDVNQAAEELSGYDRATLLTMRVADLCAAEDQATVVAALATLPAEDGSNPPLAFTWHTWPNEGGSPAFPMMRGHTC